MEEILIQKGKGLKILFVSQLFDPENSIKGLEFARRLHALGHEIEVVTTFPSYPGGKIFPGYKLRWKQIDVIDGVKIVRLPTYISHGNSSIKRILSYLSFGIIGSIYSLFFAKRPDIVYAYYPPVIVGLLAVCIKKFRKVPFIYDVQDMWPEVLVATKLVKDGNVTHLIDKLCSLIYRNAVRVVVLSDGYQKILELKAVPKDKIERIFNWCDEGRIDDESGIAVNIIDSTFFNILYAGNLGAAQALQHVVDAACLVKENKKIRFIFLGTGVAAEQLKQKTTALALDNVQFFPQIPVEQVKKILSAADVLLVHLADEAIFEITIPSKTQAYFMAGRPVLMAVKGEAADIVKAAGAGIVVEPCQPECLAQAVKMMSALPPSELESMGRSGRDYYIEKMSMEVGVRTVDFMLKNIAVSTT